MKHDDDHVDDHDDDDDDPKMIECRCLFRLHF